MRMADLYSDSRRQRDEINRDETCKGHYRDGNHSEHQGCGVDVSTKYQVRRK